MPSLSDDEALLLAGKYNFSGGQIENITRKQAVEEVLTGESTDINRLMELCDEEFLEKNQTRRRVGF